MLLNIRYSGLRNLWGGFWVSVAMLGLLPSGFAQGTAGQVNRPGEAKTPSVVVHLEQFKVLTQSNGQESLVEAPTIKPGDVIEYRATYTNRDSKPVSGLQAILPIPEGMEYLPKTARPGPGKVQVATRDSVYGAEPLTRQVRVNGRLLTESVPYVQYRSLRWDLNHLAPGARQTVAARAQLETLDSAKQSDAGKAVAGNSK